VNNTPLMKAQHAAAVLTVVLAAALDAQQPEFKGGVELVTVPVSVMTRDHNTFIDGLTAADFTVEENGQKQIVTTVTRQRRPFSLVMVIDSSGSMALGNRRELATMAAQRIVEGLKPDDELSIVLFGEQLEVLLPWTRVGRIATFDLSAWRPYGNTPLNDGMRAGLELIDKASNPRRAIALITDGFENASRVSTAALVKSRQQSETTVYGIGVGSAAVGDLAADQQHLRTQLPPANADNLRRIEEGTPAASPSGRQLPALPNFDYLETLVGDSGGSVNRLLSPPEVAMAVKNIIAELEYEYLVGFTPSKALDGKYRRLKVQVNRRGTFVRHRGGYLAVPLAQ
jgi:VWFA-related protein